MEIKCPFSFQVSLLRGLKQANIVTLHDIIHTQTSLTLVFEFLERDLKQYMEVKILFLSVNFIMVNLGYVGRETSNEQRQNIFVSIAAWSDLLSPEEYTSS